MMARIILSAGLLLLLFLDAEWLGANRESTAAFVLSLTTFGFALRLVIAATRPDFKGLEFGVIHFLIMTLLVLLLLSTYRLGPFYLSEFYLIRYGLLAGLIIGLSQPACRVDLRFVQVLFAVSSILILFSVSLHCFTGWSWGRSDLDPAGGLSFTFGNRNHFSAFTLVALFLSAPLPFHAKNTAMRVFGVLGLVSGLALVFLGGSRGGFLQAALFGVLFSFVAAWLFRRQGERSKLHLYVPLVVSLALIVLFGLLQPEYMSEKFQALFGHDSDLTRLNLWSAVLKMVSESPVSLLFGFGSGFLFSNASAFPTERLGFQASIAGAKFVHSEYFEILLETGLVGLLLFGAFVFLFARAHLRALFDESFGKTERLDALSVICSLGAVAGFAAFSVASRYSTVLLPLALIVGVAVSVFSTYRLRIKPDPSRALIAVFTLSCLWSSWTFGEMLVADHHYRAFARTMESWRESVLLADDPIESENHRGYSEKAEFHSESGLQANPEHIHLLYRKHERLLARSHEVPRSEIDVVYESIERLIPNFGGLWTKQAEYWISQGYFVQGIELAEKAASTSYYNIDLEIRVAFYYLLARDREAYSASIRRAITKAFEAEVAFPSDKEIDFSRDLIAEVHSSLLQEIASLDPVTLQTLRQTVVIQLREQIWTTGAEEPVFMQFFSRVD